MYSFSELYAHRERWAILEDVDLELADLDKIVSIARIPGALDKALEEGLVQIPDTATQARERFWRQPEKATEFVMRVEHAAETADLIDSMGGGSSSEEEVQEKIAELHKLVDKHEEELKGGITS